MTKPSFDAIGGDVRKTVGLTSLNDRATLCHVDAVGIGPFTGVKRRPNDVHAKLVLASDVHSLILGISSHPLRQLVQHRGARGGMRHAPLQ